MFIQLTNKEDADRSELWLNLDHLVSFRSDNDGGTMLLLTIAADAYAFVKEEPYKVWARIRAEENARTRSDCK